MSETSLLLLDTHIYLLPAIHGDPLDRLLIATACCLDAQLASLNEKFRAYPQLTGRLIG